MSKGTHQAHVLIGAPTFAGTDARRFALLLLNNMLGGPGMNSRLSLSLREKAGLVYSIDSYLNTYPDTGFWNVYFGCDAHDVGRCRRLLLRELRRFIERPLSDSQLAAAKKQLCGQVVISTDAAEGYALAPRQNLCPLRHPPQRQRALQSHPRNHCCRCAASGR